jgi:hypothetical protein
MTTALGLEIRLEKCCAYSATEAAAVQVANALHIKHAKEGFLPGGVPIGSEAYMRVFVVEKADNACALVDSLMDLPLPWQDKFLVLRSSIQPRLAHLARVVCWTELAALFACLEAYIAHAIITLIQRPRIYSSAEDDQVALPL